MNEQATDDAVRAVRIVFEDATEIPNLLAEWAVGTLISDPSARAAMRAALGHGDCDPRHKAGGYCCVHGDVRP